jgi:3-ketosteroid 9alpha-monooxygenase subunit B
MIDPKRAGVSEEQWREATASCHELRVARVVSESHDSMSIVLEIPEPLRDAFGYRAGQFLSFKVPFEGQVLVRSYSLSSSPDTDSEHKVTVKRVDDGRISNLFNDEVREGSRLMVVPPAGFFVLEPGTARDLTLFSGGSGITPCISILKTALRTTGLRIRLVYANRDERSIIFRDEIEALRREHADRLSVIHSLDDVHGLVTAQDVAKHVDGALDRDFYLCGPGAFMDTVEEALLGLGVARERIHIERFVSPPDPGSAQAQAPAVQGEEVAPSTIAIVLDGERHEIAYEAGERVLATVRRAGLEPPFSCEEGYCSCCMAKLRKGRVVMAANDCLTPELVDEGWVLTCQSRCVSPDVEIEYPD